MAKKKSKSSVRDSRGYATSSVSNKKPAPKPISKAGATQSGVVVAGKSIKKVQVSQTAQDEIAALLDELKSSLVLSSSTTEIESRALHFSVDDKRMMKKIATLVSLFAFLHLREGEWLQCIHTWCREARRGYYTRCISDICFAYPSSIRPSLFPYRMINSKTLVSQLNKLKRRL